MGEFYNIRCLNKSCGSMIKIRIGNSMSQSRYARKLKEEILAKEKPVPNDVYEILQGSYSKYEDYTKEQSRRGDFFSRIQWEGDNINIIGTYYCSNCKKWENLKLPYVIEYLHVSPYGTIRDYKIHYIEDIPKCSTCGGEVKHILFPTSGKNKCPLCGETNMRAKQIGFFD